LLLVHFYFILLLFFVFQVSTWAKNWSHTFQETDSPFMAPVPYRGRVSHSGMIPLVARQIAQIKQVDVKTVIECTTNNACRMYGIQVSPALHAWRSL
jgi:hypothetical protein